MISVIVPYNKDRGFLRECIESIEKQKDVDFEIIESHSENGFSYNFNRGLEKAKGIFCKFVAEDDMLAEGGLKKLQDAIEDNYWVFANAIQKDSPDWIYKPGDYDKDFMSLRANLVTNRIHGGTTLYRTDILRKLGGADESLWTGEEYDMHMKMWYNGYPPVYLDEEVYIHRIWGGQKSRLLRKQNKQKRDEKIKEIQARYNDAVQ